MPRPLVLLALLQIGLATVGAEATGSSGKTVFRIGIVTASRGEAVLDRIEPFRRRVEATLGVETRIERLPDVPRLIEAFARGRVDLAHLSAAAYVAAAASCGCVEPLAVARAADGTAGFRAVAVVRTSSTAKTRNDLAGRRVAVAGTRSIVGLRLAAQMLTRDVGGDGPTFDVVDGPEAALAALLSGRDEAALVWSTLEGDPIEGYGRGTLHDAVARGTVSMSDLRVVWSSPELPHGPQVVRSGLDEAKKRALRDMFVDLADLDPDAYDAVEPIHAGGYLRIGDAAYRPYRMLVVPSPAAAPVPAAPAPTINSTGR